MDEEDVALKNSRDLEFKIFFSLPDDHLYDGIFLLSVHDD
jgi:hypothetical protein